MVTPQQKNVFDDFEYGSAKFGDTLAGFGWAGPGFLINGRWLLC